MASPRNTTIGDERRAVVSKAFVELFGRLERLLGEQWLGAWNVLERFTPALATDLEAAEARADEIARLFIRHVANQEQLSRALVEYEAQWQRAAEFLGGFAAWPERAPCASCGRSDAVVGLLQDDGTWLCSRCHRSGPPAGRK